MENAKKFFEEIAKTEETKALFASIEAPKTEEERIAAYVDIAKKLGIELTAEEVKAYLESTAEVATGEIDDDELEQLVGGGENVGCADTFQHRENCWWNDGCDRFWNEYEGYLCSGENYGETNENKLRKKIYVEYIGQCSLIQVNEQLKRFGLEI